MTRQDRASLRALRRPTNSRLLSMLLILLALLTCWLPAPSQAATSGSVRVVQIGFAGPLSGSSARIGKSQMHAAELALAEANARGATIGGEPVIFKLLPQDDRGDPNTAALVATYLVKSGVVAVIGHWHTGASMQAASIYNTAGIPQIAPGSSGHQYTQNGYATSFRIIGHDDDGGRFASVYALQNLKARRIAVIHDETTFGTMLAAQFIRGVQDKGGEIVTQQLISSKTSDFNAALMESGKKSADLIFFGGLGPQAAALVLSMRRMSITAPLLAADGIVSPLFLQLTGTGGNGTFGLAPGQPQEKMTGWKKFQEKFNATYDDPIEAFAPFAYDAANMIVAAIQQTNSQQPARINAALHSMKYKGLTGTIAFDAEGNLNNPAFTIYQVQSGKWTAVQAYGKK
ncbi:branched-chain amino acid ABC transporter substrate-binding protein [Herbaspirillum rhizosphaerae]|uniref:Branched-chain amino acid ABC transporter substrate-binding protein n=2 Tax=Herbaspirillum rhizosphaerae TaxID=346179 RepID=A0ABW8ZAB8_9BURK